MIASFSSLSILVLGGILLIQSSASFKQPRTPKCKWYEYYDSNMDNCGPCREICINMKRTRTEDQCKLQCSAYLVSLNCTYKQYYDQNVDACAPCAEICDQQDLIRTTNQCSTKCVSYLISKNCTMAEYFNETTQRCQACSHLCSQQDQDGKTSMQCFLKCSDYVQIAIPGHIKENNHGIITISETPDAEEPSWHPGLVVFVVIATLIIAGGVVTLVVYWQRSRQKNRYALTSAEDPAHARTVGNGREEDLSKEPPPSIQVSSDFEQTSGETNAVTYAIPESDPLGPSSAAAYRLLEERQTRAGN